MSDILNYQKALELLKKGIVLTDDNINSFYVMRNDNLINYRNGSRYALCIEDFESLFKNHTFRIYEEESGIDENKDSEYYSFKHK